ncbi:hypothetical protein WJX81_001068 [Elliptochloris bilobata]|uniref:SHSP domain-containing protein n=1 Tax=Elliptochloris bilobata TaxID=381761 RepID=A0AAW1QXQ3_9CHLO
MDQDSARRIAVLSGQLLSCKGGIAIQDCAATNTLRYGRAVGAGARFARPCTSEQAGLDYHKEAALQHAVRSYAVAGRKDAHQDLPDPPSFARPTVEPQPHEPNNVTNCTEPVRRVPHTSEAQSSGWKPRVTVVETERVYCVTLWLPGVDMRSLRINQSGRRLTVSGSRTAGRQGVTRFALGWDLPANVDVCGITARTFIDGKDARAKWRRQDSLTIFLPKLG